MSPDLSPESLAELVVETVATALAAPLERVAGAEARVAALGDVRDRVLVLEARAGAPPVEDPAVGALRERVAAAEFRVELKAAETAPLLAAVAAVTTEAREVRDRVVALETRAADIVPAPDADLVATVVELEARIEAAENVAAAHATELADLAARVGALEGEQRTTRERLLVLEVRAVVPGPAGKDGAPGAPGRDGVDGLGFEDLAVAFDGNRTIALTFARGGVEKVFPIVLPFLRYQGVYQAGTAYDAGDVVTWAGSAWVAGERTITKPGDGAGAKAWRLCVKQGRDGRDGAPGPMGPEGRPGRVLDLGGAAR